MFSAQDLSDSRSESAHICGQIKSNFCCSRADVELTYERIRIGGGIAITISPDPAWYVSTDPERQYDQLWNMLLRHSNKVFKRYIFTPGLTKQGNIHVHGAFVIGDRKKYYKFWLPKAKRLGIPKYAVKFNSKELDDNWLEYLYKNHDECVGIIDECPIIFTENTSFIYARKLKTYSRLVRLNKRKKVEKKPIPMYTLFGLDDVASDDSIN